MQVIYATGQLGDLDFAVTDRRNAVPAGAIVFAVCTANRTIENLDEDLFEAITDGELYTFRALVRDATERETQRQSTQILPVDKFLAWLLGQGARPAMAISRVARRQAAHAARGARFSKP